VVAECFNSNTLNLAFGICLPGLLVGLGLPSAHTVFALAWLIGMTIVAAGLLCWRGGLRRLGGSVLVALALIFAGVVICWPLFVRR
jgi:Ca2+/Na+ antiporter